MFDLIELFTHWHAGRSQRQLAESLGIDRKTIAKYLAPAIAESVVPGGEPVTEQGPALRQLGREHGQRMLLDLLLRGVQPPATGVAVSPLRTDDHVRMTALGQPAGQEFLRPAVGTSRVDVPDPGRVGSVQHREGPGPHPGHAAVGQVLLTAAGYVRRAAQSGQPQPDPGDHRSRGPECRRGHADRAPVIADHGHYGTGGPASGISPG